MTERPAQSAGAPPSGRRSTSSPLSGLEVERSRPARPGGSRVPAIAPELTPAERAAALSKLGGPAPAGTPLDPSRIDAARARMRAAVTPPEAPASPTAVDPGRFDAAQERLRAARSGGRRKPS